MLSEMAMVIKCKYFFQDKIYFSHKQINTIVLMVYSLNVRTLKHIQLIL